MNAFDYSLIVMLVLALGLNYYMDILVASRVLPRVRQAQYQPQAQRTDMQNLAQLGINLVSIYQWVSGGGHVLLLILLWEDKGFSYMMLIAGLLLCLNMLLARRAHRYRIEINSLA